MKKGTLRNSAFVGIKRVSIISGSIVFFSILIMLLIPFHVIVAESPPEENSPQEEQSSGQRNNSPRSNESANGSATYNKITLEEYINSLNDRTQGNNSGSENSTPVEEGVLPNGGFTPLGLTDDDTLAYFSFDNPDDVENDDSGNGRDLTLGAGDEEPIITGNTIHGRTLDFDGVDDHAYRDGACFDTSTDITIEAWIFSKGQDEYNKMGTIMDRYKWSSGQRVFNFYLDTSNNLILTLWDDQDASTTVTSTQSIPENEWHYVAGTFKASTKELAIYIDGVKDNSDTAATGSIKTNANVKFRIGDNDEKGSGSNPFYGIIDEVSVSDTVREIGYTMGFWNFNDGSPNTDVTETSDVVRNRSPQGDDLNGSIYNMNGGGLDWRSGIYGSSLEFDGYNDYVQVLANDCLHLTDETTIEVWVNWDGDGTTGSYDTIVAEAGHFWLFIGRSGAWENKVVFGSGNAPWWPYIVTSSSIPINEWTHIAVVRSDATHAKIYINGILDVTGTTYAPTGNSANPLYIGAWGGTTHCFNGKIDELRISNYEKTFGADDIYGGDALQLPFEGSTTAQRLDDKTPLDNDMDYANTSIVYSADSGKYGGCYVFDGTNDYLKMDPYVPASLNPTDAVTVEAWIYPTAMQLSCIVDNSYRANTGEEDKKGGYVLRMRDTGAIQFWIYDNAENSFSVQTTATVDVDEWWHVAGVYDGYNLRVYINGVCEAQTSCNIDIGYGTDLGLIIGAKYWWDGQFFEGRIDEVRISNYPRTFHEDLDGDCMADMYEIMRSPFSDQYNPMEHNGRYALLVAPVREDDEMQYKYDITQMHHNLISWGWDDRDIIFLTCSDSSGRGDLSIGDSYNGDWIDGEAYHNNLDGDATHDTAFDALQNGGDYSLQQNDDTWDDFILSKPEETDIVFIHLRDHGAGYDAESSTNKGGREDTSGEESHDPENPDHDEGFCTYSYNRYGFDSDDYWYDDELNDEFDSITSKYMILSFDMCYSGGFIQDCEDDNRVVVSSDEEYDGSGRYMYLLYGRFRGFPVEVEYFYDGSTILYESHDETSNADGISGVDVDGPDNILGNDDDRSRLTNTDYEDTIISITEAHYMADIVTWDRDQEDQEPQISIGADIPDQIFL